MAAETNKQESTERYHKTNIGFKLLVISEFTLSHVLHIAEVVARRRMRPDMCIQKGTTICFSCCPFCTAERSYWF